MSQSHSDVLTLRCLTWAGQESVLKEQLCQDVIWNLNDWAPVVGV